MSSTIDFSARDCAGSLDKFITIVIAFGRISLRGNDILHNLHDDQLFRDKRICTPPISPILRRGEMVWTKIIPKLHSGEPEPSAVASAFINRNYDQITTKWASQSWQCCSTPLQDPKPTRHPSSIRLEGFRGSGPVHPVQLPHKYISHRVSGHAWEKMAQFPCRRISHRPQPSPGVQDERNDYLALQDHDGVSSPHRVSFASPQLRPRPVRRGG